MPALDLKNVVRATGGQVVRGNADRRVEGFSISVVTEEANLFEVAALVFKDSVDQLNNPNFNITVAAVAWGD